MGYSDAQEGVVSLRYIAPARVPEGRAPARAPEGHQWLRTIGP